MVETGPAGESEEVEAQLKDELIERTEAKVRSDFSCQNMQYIGTERHDENLFSKRRSPSHMRFGL